MVWQYTEPYPENPYLEDWVSKKFRFGIQMAESTVGTTPTGMVIGGELREVEVIESDGILKPSFYLMGNKTDRPYHLSLNLNGFARLVYSTRSKGKFKGCEVIKVNRREFGQGNFEDFKTVASYAAERLPKIAEEIVLDPRNFLNDIPKAALEEILKDHHRCLEILDWQGAQRDISHQFYVLLTMFMRIKPDQSGAWNSPRKGDDKFTPEQIRELQSILAPLNKRFKR